MAANKVNLNSKKQALLSEQLSISILLSFLKWDIQQGVKQNASVNIALAVI